jgi:hypothetical protein
MPRDENRPDIVSLEGHRRRRAEESRAQAKAQAARAKAAKAYRAGVVPGEKAINWRKAPLALAAMALLFAAMWLVGRMMG